MKKLTREQKEASKIVDKVIDMFTELAVTNQIHPLEMVSAMTFYIIRILKSRSIPDDKREMVEEFKKWARLKIWTELE